MSPARKKIGLLILGGTVLSAENPERNAVISEKDIKPWLSKMPELNIMATIEPIFISGEKEIEPKIEQWIKAARLIKKRINSHDGFIITHHTSSLLFAACAFSFMLQNLSKPVVFTGSQIPFLSSLSRADQKSFQRYKGLGIKANLINAAQVAIQGPSEVTIMFGNKLVRANQAFKTKNLSLNLFDAPEKAILGTIDFGIKISDSYLKQKNKAPFLLKTKFDSKVITFNYFPEMDKNLFNSILDARPSGILIQGFNPGFSVSQLKKFIQSKSNIPIVIHTDHPFPEIAFPPFIIISNMTFEATLIKFMWILGQTKNKKKIAKLFKTNIAGEIIEE